MPKFTKLDIQPEDYLDDSELLEDKVQELHNSINSLSWEEYVVGPKGNILDPHKVDFEDELSQNKAFYKYTLESSKRYWTLEQCVKKMKQGIDLGDRESAEAADAFGLFNILYNIRKERFYLPASLKHLEPI